MGYPAKVQRISRPNNSQWYVNFPNALAEALQLQKGETIEWEIHDRQVILMVRTQPTPARNIHKRRSRQTGKHGV